MAIRFLGKAAAVLERHRTGCLTVSCAGLFGANLAFHIFPEQTCRTLYQAWAKGKPEEPSERLLRLFREVLRDVTVETDKGFRAFVTFSFHPVSAGLPWLPAGCVVGIPANFSSSAKGESEISAHVITIKGKEVDWESPEGLALKEALTLSPAAQKFAIAREIVYLQNHSPLICAAVAPVFLAGTYGSGVAIKGLLGLYSGPVRLRSLCNIVVLALGYVGYCLAYDTVSQAADYRADRHTATISTDFARGGVEFYNKILSQNQIFRTLMGKQGKKIYAPNGNLFPRHWIRFKHASYTSRRDLIINILNTPQA